MKIKLVILSFLFLPSIGLSVNVCDVSSAIGTIVGGVPWSMVNNDTYTFVSASALPSDAQIAAQIAVCQAQQAQIAAWQLELSTTTAVVVGLGAGYVGASAVTQINYNAKMVRIVQLRSLLGLP